MDNPDVGRETSDHSTPIVRSCAMGSCELPVVSSICTATTLEETKLVWRRADAVCFDVDSTVCVDEGIDELAKFAGKGDDVASLTEQAMRGGMMYQDALRIRLNVIRPSIKTVQSFVIAHPPELTPHIKDLVSTLQNRGTAVYLISGGFCSIVEPVARILQIPVENIFCNRLKFYYGGEYAGFDEDEPTSHSGGKGEVIQLLKNRHGYQRVVMVGDGATDMEACPPADAFIGFGGNQIRERVRNEAKWFVTDFQDLINELNSNNDSSKSS